MACKVFDLILIQRQALWYLDQRTCMSPLKVNNKRWHDTRTFYVESWVVMESICLSYNHFVVRKPGHTAMWHVDTAASFLSWAQPPYFQPSFPMWEQKGLCIIIMLIYWVLLSNLQSLRHPSWNARAWRREKTICSTPLLLYPNL